MSRIWDEILYQWNGVLYWARRLRRRLRHGKPQKVDLANFPSVPSGAKPGDYVVTVTSSTRRLTEEGFA